MNYDPEMLDDLARIFAEAALREFEKGAADAGKAPTALMSIQKRILDSENCNTTTNAPR